MQEVAWVQENYQAMMAEKGAKDPTAAAIFQQVVAQMQT